MSHDSRKKLKEACAESGLEKTLVIGFIQREWILLEKPEQQRSPSEEVELDEEDLARIQLILELQRDLGVNDEGVPIILHLLDQVHALRLALRKKVA
jgi:chaperone modulatory protein CbpM